MNESALKKIFAETFELSPEAINDNLQYQQTPRWDSIGHMALVAALDDAFSIMLDTDDVIDMSSYKKAKEILSKYGITFET